VVKKNKADKKIKNLFIVPIYEKRFKN